MSTYYIAFSVLVLFVSSVFASNLGTACDDDSECTTENAICYKEYSSCSRGECTCELGYYRRQAGATCLLEREIGESCTDDEDCTILTLNSHCSDVSNQCECDEQAANKVYYDPVSQINYCYTFAMGEECLNDEDCLTYQLDGSAGDCGTEDGASVCGCTNAFQRNGERCEPYAYGEICDDGSVEFECVSNSVCADEGNTKTCQCDTNDVWNEAHQACVHNALTEANEGEDCTVNFLTATSGQICREDKECDSCPGETQTVCQEPVNGAGTVGQQISAIMPSLVIMMFMMF